MIIYKNKENVEWKEVDDMIGFLTNLLFKWDKELIKKIKIEIELDNVKEIKKSNTKKGKRSGLWSLQKK